MAPAWAPTLTVVRTAKQRKIYISKIAELHFFPLSGTCLVNAGEQQGRTEKKTFKCMELKAYSRPLSLWFSLCKLYTCKTIADYNVKSLVEVDFCLFRVKETKTAAAF